MSCFSGVFITGDNDPAWVKIVVQGLGLSEKFRAENNIVIVKLLFVPKALVRGAGIVDLITIVAAGFTLVTRLSTASTAEVSK